MYIVEARIDPVEHYYDKYFFVGEAEQVAEIKSYIGNVALGDIETHTCARPSDIYNFLSNLAVSDGILKRDHKIFESFYKNREELADNRIAVLTGAAAEGAMTYDALAKEITQIKAMGENLDDWTDWLTKDGYYMDYPGSCTPQVEDLKALADAYGEDSEPYRTAQSLGLQHYTYQYDVIHPQNRFESPTVVSNLEHVTLGELRGEEFTPVVTVFSADKYSSPSE